VPERRGLRPPGSGGEHVGRPAVGPASFTGGRQLDALSVGAHGGVSEVKLTVGIGEAIENPSERQIEAALHSLPGGDDSFAILGSGEQFYVQAAGGAAEAFALECRSGSASEHYRCNNTSLLLEEVLAAFLSYHRSDSEFKRTLDWEREVEESPPRRLPLLVLAVLAAIAAVVLWQVIG